MLRCRWGEWWCEIWGIRTTLKKSFPFLPRPNCWHIWIEIDCRSILVSCMNAIIWFLFPIVQRWAFGKRRNPVLAIKSLVSAWRFISLWKQPRHNDQSLSRAFFIAGKGIMPRSTRCVQKPIPTSWWWGVSCEIDPASANHWVETAAGRY